DNNQFLIKRLSHWQGEIVKFETEYSRKIENTCSYLISEIYDISISPRTPEIKNDSRIIQGKQSNGNDSYLPLLNGRNLKCNKTICQLYKIFIKRD
ncbi:Modification methylase TaqI (Adenine-specific methyltransferase TaqI) (M.TaqI), partial [Candidatus Magnetoovum chiemensis]